ncbi:4-amino-4-deoxy-L-arabinose transferase-like glycosyltransferase [Actinomadura coerulea]|uniref:4-amino-4-deoxy-L-arabinose transferase-like glycosyltransferase n=1 Tax=Actinomadura coerulea TaxID=46159 RepID=A0A7X0KYM7_9ACTN|nr:hypothetical protein [Actinomadura coerulea]MBB6395565.1 4-amino-4-deoxy-L-arabinose transferase-like glycosyltransferase [Actinomadura coerulea]GGQ25398.1 hypothetical protein GCM10010187_47390 [Actinomadura coerulea]
MFGTLMLLLGPWLVFRLLGMLGVARFATWRTSGAHALAAMLLCTGTAHFLPDSVTVMPSHADLTAMVPPFAPLPHLMVYATGVLELLGALGPARTATRCRRPRRAVRGDVPGERLRRDRGRPAQR